MRLRQSVNAYLAMKAALTTARHHNRKPAIQFVAVPGLGTGVGALRHETAALQMWKAFSEVVLQTTSYPADFGEAQKNHRELNPDEINLWDRKP
jgi:O-acetyl-ADP-ribose deacetylase (regulator of RNase III)